MLKLFVIATLAAATAPKKAASIPSLYKTKPTAEQVQSCYAQICGPTIQNLSVVDALNFRMKQNKTVFEAYWKKDIEPLYQARMKAERELQIKLREWAEQELKETKPLEMAGSDKILFAMNSFYSANFFKDLVRFNPEKEKFEINENEFDKRVAKLNDDQKALAHLFLEDVNYANVLDNAETIDENGIEENRLVVWLKNKFPKSKPTEALRLQAERTLLTYTQLSKSMTPVAARLSLAPYEGQLGLLEKARKTADLTRAESEQFVNMVVGLRTLANLYANPKIAELVAKVNLDYTGLKKRIEKAQVLKGWDELIHPSEARVKARLKRHDVCKDYVAGHLAARIDAKSSAQFKTTTLELVRAAQHVLIDDFGITDGVLLGEVGRTRFAQPDSDFLYPQFLTRMQNGIRYQKQVLEMEKKAPADARKLALLVAMSDLPQEDRADFDGDFVSDCQNFIVPDLTDFSVTVKGYVSASWFTVLFPERGAGIVAHEIGHIVSNIVRTKIQKSRDIQKWTPFINRYQCVRDRNPYVLKVLSTDNNSVWGEEDWSDHFASLVLKKYQSWQPVKATNLGCVLTPELKGRYNVKSTDPLHEDVHSSGILRTLFIAMDREGSVPKACESLLSYAQPHRRELMCR